MFSTTACTKVCVHFHGRWAIAYSQFDNLQCVGDAELVVFELSIFFRVVCSGVEMRTSYVEPLISLDFCYRPYRIVTHFPCNCHACHGYWRATRPLTFAEPIESYLLSHLYITYLLLSSSWTSL